MGKELWEILVPVKWNDGREIPLEHHQDWDRQVRHISRGLTILKPAKGQWIGPDGRLFVEPMIPVRIACGRRQIEKIMAMTAGHYDQKMVMAYRVSDLVLTHVR